MSAYSDWAPQQFDEAAAGIAGEQSSEAQQAAAGAPAAEADAAAAAAAEAPVEQGAASSSEPASAGFVYDSNSGGLPALHLFAVHAPPALS
jgi:hypothetical protein